jgi:hypothetical protein
MIKTLPKLKNLPEEIEKTLPLEVKQFRQFLRNYHPEYFEVEEDGQM